MAASVAWQVVSSMKNEQQSQNLLLKVDQRSTFRNIFLQPPTNVFVAEQVDRARWKTENMDENLQRNNVARQHPKDYETEKMMGAANLFAIKIISARHF